MVKKFIGKRVRLVLGGDVPVDQPDTIIGQDTTVHVPSGDLHKYDKIVGEEVSLRIGDLNQDLQKIVDTLESSEEPNKKEIIRVSKEIMKESNKQTKIEKAKTLISLASGISSIALTIIDIKTKLGL